jgi:hypothetical protein
MEAAEGRLELGIGSWMWGSDIYQGRGTYLVTVEEVVLDFIKVCLIDIRILLLFSAESSKHAIYAALPDTTIRVRATPSHSISKHGASQSPARHPLRI